jgi:hypothetical protein
MATAGKPRVRAARVDSTIRKLIVEIERRYKLPRGSVRIVRPNGRRMRSDSTVRALLNAW